MQYFNAVATDEETGVTYEPSLAFLVTDPAARAARGAHEAARGRATRHRNRAPPRRGARRAAPERRAPADRVSSARAPAPPEPVVQAMPAPEPAAPAAATPRQRDPFARSQRTGPQPYPERTTPAAASETPDPAEVWTPKRGGAAEDASAGPSAQIAIGAGLLAVGLVALFGGFAVAEVRRRRATARATRHR